MTTDELTTKPTARPTARPIARPRALPSERPSERPKARPTARTSTSGVGSAAKTSAESSQKPRARPIAKPIPKPKSAITPASEKPASKKPASKKPGAQPPQVKQAVAASDTEKSAVKSRPVAPAKAPAAAASAGVETVTKPVRRMPDFSGLRNSIAKVVWLICLICACLLAVGALLVALQGRGTNPSNELFVWITQQADKVDFGALGRVGGLFEFAGPNAGVKNALANWGAAAIVWLLIGRILDRTIRP